MADITIDSLVDAGNASGGPPLGPALGPIGVKVQDVVDEINKRTEAFKGMKIPVKVIINPGDKSFRIEVGSPPTSALIKKELGLEKGGLGENKEPAGDITLEKVVEIAGMKKDALMGKDLKARAKEVIGACKSLGVNIEGRDPKEMAKEIDEGKHNDRLKD